MGFWLHNARARQAERIAIEYGDRRVSYQELLTATVQGAAALNQLGVRGWDQRVAIALEDRLDFAVAFHACVFLGSPAVPIDQRLSDEEQATRAARADVVITDPLHAGGGVWTGSGPLTSDGVLTVMHTSGTTSAPKPVELTEANWMANALGSAVALGLDPAERWLCPMPLSHVGGLSILIRSTIYATTVVLHERFDTDAVLRELMDPARRITLVSLVPTMLARLLDAGLERPPTLRWALLGGGPIAPALLARAADAGVPVAPSYGMTEACSQIATFGFPLTGVDVQLDGAGEVIVRGPIVAPGALADDGWLHSGDLGSLDESGRLTIIGRASDTIVSGGENVAPAEVEAALLEHPDVADAGVHARSDPEWGEAVVAKIVVRPGSTPSPEQLAVFCAQRIARFKVPKAFEFVAELPRTPSGKLLRRELG